MASTFSPNLRIELIGAGEQAGAWNNTTNTNLGTLIEQAITGITEVTIAGGDVTLEADNGAEDQARSMTLILTGTPGASRNVIAPDVDKVYIVRNQTANSHTIKTASGTGVSVPANSSALVFCDKDADSGNGVFYNAVEDLAAGASIAGAEIVTTSGTQTLTNKTLTAPKFADGGFIADANGNELIIMDTVTSAVNEVTVANAATSSGPSISSTGSDTNIDLLLVAKGTGVVKAGGVEVVTLTGTQALSNKTLTAPKFADLGFIADANGNELIVMDTVSGSVNEIKIANAATGTGPTLSAQGDDTNVSLNLSAKGSGTVNTSSIASFSAGTASLPSIIPSGDPNTGVWFPAADTIAFSTSGTEDLRIGPAGQIGIAGANYGTSGQVLTSGGSSAAPSWSNVGGITSLGTANTTSGTSATVSGLTLTGYKFLIISLNGVSHNSTSNRAVNVSSSTTVNTGAQITDNNISASTLVYVQAFLNLANGAASGAGEGGLSGITTASTSVSLVLNGSGSFDAGSFTVFGVS
jgi:hypothetical protein